MAAINTSKSKALFSFSKDSRFKDVKVNTTVNAYSPKDLWSEVTKSFNTKPVGFGGIDRFNYLH